MSTQLIAIVLVLGLVLFVLFVAWCTLAACVLSGRISENERQAEILAALAALPGSAHYDDTEHNDD